VFLLLFLVGFWAIGGLVPPPSPAQGAAKIAAFYREHTDQLRAGLLICMIATPLMVPFIVLLTLQLKRSDPRLAPLAYTQLACGLVLMLLILLPVTLMALAAFRPERPPESTQLINDAAFFILFWTFSAPTLEYISLGLAVLMDRGERPLFPRWVGWFDISVGLIFAAGAPVLFVKHGVFAWDGVLAFWAVLAAFGAWVMLTFVGMLRAIDRPVAPG
jgi:hypothetical protein